MIIKDVDSQIYLRDWVLGVMSEAEVILYQKYLRVSKSIRMGNPVKNISGKFIGP